MVGLFALAGGKLAVGAVAVVLAAVAPALGVAWLVRVHRRVRSAELDWAATHSDRPAPPPAS